MEETKDTTLGVAEQILLQMGGMRGLKLMLGIKFAEKIADGNGLAFRFPSRTPSLGNHVEVTLRPDDTYDMAFYYVGRGAKRPVRTFAGVYADQLIELFEKQTGYTLRVPKIMRLS